MDIELRLREILPLRDPGAAFTDGVMARVAQAPAVSADAGVVQLSEARARRRSRRILLATAVVIGAAAAMPAYFLGDGTDGPGATAAVALVPGGATDSDPDVQVPVQAVFSAEPLGAGQSPPNCIDPDVLRGLLLPGSGVTFRVTADAPPELDGFKPPRQLGWVGASERGAGTMAQSTVSAVYRSTLTPEAARNAAIGALTAAGWKLHATGNIRSSSVFAAVNMQIGDTYCRDGKQATLTASGLEGVTWVVLSIPRNADRNSGLSLACNNPPQAISGTDSTLDAYLPQLELPRDPATGGPVIALGGGGGINSDTDRRMNVSFTLKDSVDNVARHFAGQMAQQAWRADASWSGAGTAGSSWTRQVNAGTVLLGTLGVSAFDEGRFTVVFHVVRTK